MRTAFVCPDSLSLGLFCGETLRQLALLGPVTVLTDRSDGRIPELPVGAELKHVPVRRTIAPAADVKYTRDLYREFKSGGYDVVFNFSTKPNVYGAIAAALARSPRVVSHVVGLGSAFVTDDSIKGRVVRRVTGAFYRLAGYLSDAVWFTNRRDIPYFLSPRRRAKAVLTKNYLDVTYYSKEAVDADTVRLLRRELGLESHQRVVVMVARLVWSKGVGEFMNAARVVARRIPGTVCILVAPPEVQRDDIVPEANVRAAEGDGSFRWVGFREDVRTFYALSDLAVLPSYYKEGGYPRALLEPMSMEKAVIASDSEDCRGPVDPGVTGLLVPVRDASALADAICRLLNNDGERRRFAEASRQRILAEFDERVVVRDAIAQLVGR